MLFSAYFIANKIERKTSIHLTKIQQARGEDLKEYMMRFNREVVIIPNLQLEVTYTAFLNGLLLRRFKCSLAESEVTLLVEALRRAQDFIQATKIYASDDFVQPDNRKRGGKDKGPQTDKRPRKDEESVVRFYTNSRNSLLEIKDNSMLRHPKPIEPSVKFRNKNKYYEYHKDTGTLPLSVMNSRKPCTSWSIRDSLTTY